MLEGVADTGRSLVLVGPRRALSGSGGPRLDALLLRPNVTWVPEQPPAAIADYLAALDVGLTPYADSDFNRASFPLKTLEYLAAGLPVVTSDLPASRQLDTQLVTVAEDRDDFVRQTVRLLDNHADDSGAGRRRAFAAEHTWSARARTLLAWLDEARVDEGVGDL